jgi:NAD(P)-dependent dehydrogenase (short-subunit alcohol dehydrogenase family)
MLRPYPSDTSGIFKRSLRCFGGLLNQDWDNTREAVKRMSEGGGYLMYKEILVIIGAGGIGQAIARRQGTGKTILLADINDETYDSAARVLRATGHTVTTQFVDVSSRESVNALARAAAGMGNVVQVIHTAGVSPNQASPKMILSVDLFGTALVLEEFAQVIAIGGAGIVISSMAGYMPAHLPREQEEALAWTPSDELLQLPFLGTDAVPNSGAAYALSKRANHLRVQAASIGWGDRGARINSISPGIILTPLAEHEMASESGHRYRAMIEASVAKRVGTTDEVAAAAAYLLGSEAGFITGSDLLIDGGVIAAIRAGRI